MGERCLGVWHPRQQSRHLSLASGAGELVNTGCRDRAIAGLDHTQMIVRERRDLREVGHGDHLGCLRQARQAPANLDGRSAADSGIHFVENEGGHGIDRRDHDFDREHDAAELTAGCAARDRAWRRTRVGCQEDRHFVPPGAARSCGGDGNLDLGIRHRQSMQLGGHELSEAGGSRRARRREGSCRLIESGCRLLPLPSESLDPLAVVVEFCQPCRPGVQKRDRLIQGAMRAHQFGQCGTALLDGGQFVRTRFIEVGEVPRERG